MGLFGTLRDSIRRFVGDPHTVFDPSLLGDPLAKRIKWAPLVFGGHIYRTHVLRMVSPSRMELRPSPETWLVSGALVAMGAGVLWLSHRLYVEVAGSSMEEDIPLTLYVFMAGVPMIGFGMWTLWRLNFRMTIDKRAGFWWKGSVPPSKDGSLFREGKAGTISDIHAVQLIAEEVNDGRGGRFESVEINLVQHNGTRFNLVDHGGKSVRTDGKRLAAFLGVPLWDDRDARRLFDPERDGREPSRKD